MVAVMIATNVGASVSAWWLLGVVLVLAAYWNQIVAKLSAYRHARIVKAVLTAGGTAFAAVMIGDIWGACGGGWSWLFCGF